MKKTQKDAKKKSKKWVYIFVLTIALIGIWRYMRVLESNKYNECVDNKIASLNNPNVSNFRNCIKIFSKESLREGTNLGLSLFSPGLPWLNDKLFYTEVDKVTSAECVKQISSASDAVKNEYINAIQYCSKKELGKDISAGMTSLSREGESLSANKDEPESKELNEHMDSEVDLLNMSTLINYKNKSNSCSVILVSEMFSAPMISNKIANTFSGVLLQII